jgi:Pretoxin HINT domain
VDTDGAAGTQIGSVVATAGHPFWVDDLGRFVDAEDLRAGDSVRTQDGQLVTVTATRAWTQVQRVHNLTVDGIHTYYVRAGDASVLVHNCGSALQKASDAANRAADEPSSIFVKDKHLSTFGGKYAKFNTADKSEAQSWVSEALKSDRAVFKTNGLEGTFKVETDMQRTVGTKGQRGIRAIVSDDGRVINAFPFNVGP